MPYPSQAARQKPSASDRHQAQGDPHGEWICADLQEVFAQAGAGGAEDGVAPLLATLYASLEYHLGWRDQDLRRTSLHAGKMLRPRLLLLSCELVAGCNGAGAVARKRLAQRALPAATCIELMHNFSLIHDDIEDGDEQRRGYLALWKMMGIPQAINAGDMLCSLARTSLWRLAAQGFPLEAIVAVGKLFDRTYLDLCEGQFLDISAEGNTALSPEDYFAMIERKTAALMGCAAEMGARLADPHGAEVAVRLGVFGRVLGRAFQVRDDVLGIWHAQTLGKPAYGDIRRKKMTLPMLYALEASTEQDRRRLLDYFRSPDAPTEPQLAAVLEVLERTDARQRTLDRLAQVRHEAEHVLASVAADAPQAREPLGQLQTLLADATVVRAG